MSNKKDIRIAKIHICNFERTPDELIRLDIKKYPERLCIIDETKDIVVDVGTKHQYPYVRVISMLYLLSKLEKNKIEFGKRAACIEYMPLPFDDLDSKTLDECNEIIDLLKREVSFPDGNQELTNEQYLEMIKRSKESTKVKKIDKKRK